MGKAGDELLLLDDLAADGAVFTACKTVNLTGSLTGLELSDAVAVGACTFLSFDFS